MKRNTKKTLLIGSASLLAVVLGVTVINHTAANGGLFAFRAKAQGQIIESSITFSCSASTYHRVGTSGSKYSFKGITSLGNSIYLFSDNNYNLYSTGGLVASFGSSSYASKYLSFYSDAEGENSYTFQNIQSITISTKSTSGSNAGFEIYKTISGSAAYTGTINASSSVTVSTEIAGAKYLKLVPTSSTFLDISSITISYSCDPTGGDEPETQLTSIEVSNEKRVYAQGSSFIEPTITAYYSDSTHEVVSGAIFTGFDSSTLTESQTITVSYGGQSTSYTIKIRPTETSRLINYIGYDVDYYEDVDDLTVFLDVENSTLPNYAEGGSSVTVTPVVASPFKVIEVSDWDGRVEVIDNGDGTFSFTMTNYFDSIQLKIAYQFAPDMTGIRVDKPKTSYKIGDTFVSPDVYAVYGEYGEVKLTEGYSFSGFDSTVAVESQTITVTYGDFSTNYTIQITEGGEPSDITGTYVSEKTTGNTKYQSYVTLNDDGTGTYVLYKFTSGGDLWTYEMNISYVADGDDVTLTFVSLGERVKYTGGEGGTRTSYGTMTSLSTWFDPYRPFQGSSYIADTTSQVASLDSGVLTMKRYSSSTDTGSSLALSKQ